MGGKYEGKRMEPTIIKEVKTDDVLMEESVQLHLFEGYIFDEGYSGKYSGLFFL
jgi:hypothetical protein